MTDHGNIYGAVHFFDAAKAKGIKPILGCELYVCKAEDHRADTAQRRVQPPAGAGGKRRGLPQPDPHHVGSFAARVLPQAARVETLLGGALQGVDRLVRLPVRRAVRGADGRQLRPRPKRVALEYQDIFGKGNFYLEIQDQGLEQERKIQDDLFRLEKELDIPMVATNDSHYLCGEDSHAHDVMLCVQTGAKMHETDRFKFDSRPVLCEERRRDGARCSRTIAELLARTMEIAERCNLKLKRWRIPSRNLPCPTATPSTATLSRCAARASRSALETAVHQLETARPVAQHGEPV